MAAVDQLQAEPVAVEVRSLGVVRASLCCVWVKYIDLVSLAAASAQVWSLT